MSLITEFEKGLTELLMKQDFDGARDLIVGAKQKDLDELSRMAVCRTIVLMLGNTTEFEKLQQEAAFPKYLKMTTEQLREEMGAHIEAYKATGEAAAPTRPGKAPPKGVKGNGTGGEDSDAEEGSDDEDDEDEDDEEEEDVATGKKRGRPKGSKDKKPRKRRGVKAGSRRKSEAEEEKPPEKPSEAAQSTEEPKEAPEPTPAPEMDSGAIQKLLNSIDQKTDEKLKKVDDLMKQVLINVTNLQGAVGRESDKQRQIKESTDNVKKLGEAMTVLYEQNGYIITALHFLGTQVTDMNLEQFHKAVWEMSEDLRKEAEEKMPHFEKESKDDEDEEEAAPSGGKS